MRVGVIVDTNVAIVANGKADQAGVDCIRACIAALKQVRASRRIWLDVNGLILGEYRINLSPTGQPGVGDAFFKWSWNNQANEQLCRQVRLSPLDDDHRLFAEFPDDPELRGFDRSDQKFAAVAIACGEEAPIQNASDTDWWFFREALARHGVQVHFLCPELMTLQG